MGKVNECEYSGCERTDTEEHSFHGESFYTCSECDEKAIDSTGYCSLTCILGYGCDYSC